MQERVYKIDNFSKEKKITEIIPYRQITNYKMTTFYNVPWTCVPTFRENCDLWKFNVEK